MVSPDGYVRVTAARLRAVPLAHLLSELDADLNLPPSTASGCRVRYERHGEVRSNIMLVNARCQDMGELATLAVLGVAVDNLEWERAVDDYISNRYACHLSNITVTESRPSL
jgi:hypothetical protein